VKRFVLCAVMVSALALAILALLCRRAPLQSAAPTQWLSAPPSPKATTAAAASAPGPGRKLPPSVITNPVPSAMMGAAEPEGPLADFTAFAKWAEQFVAGNASASSARGQALAWKRRQAMLELIETDPGKALSLTVPFGWRSALPASVTRYFEQWVDGRGSLDVLVGTDFERGKVTVYREAQIGQKRYKAFVYGARKSQVSQTRTPLHGIALDDKLALQSDPLRILGAAEAEALEKERGKAADQICGVSGLQADVRQQRVAAEIGGEVRYFCGPDHARLVNDQWLAAAGGSGAGAGPFAASGGSDWTHGPKTLLYMRVNFPDDLTEPISEAGAYKVMDGVNDYYTEGSYNMTAITATVTPLMTLPNTKPWYSTAGPGALLSDAREAARHAGFETGNYDRDIACFTTVPTYTFGGLAFVGGKGVWLQSTGVGVTSHELGHNYGLWHANFWNATNSIIGPGTNYEYGNIFDTMGSGGVAQFNAVHKNILNWLPDTAVHNVTSNGVYRIYTYDVPTRVEGRFYAAKVKKDFERDYWLEFRHSYISNPWLQNGVLLNWAPWPESNGGTHLLDTTPGTLADRDDAAVVIGRTFTDPGAGVHITPLGRGETGVNTWMDVQVNLGTFPGNQPPELRLEIDPPNPSPGTLVHFHAAASDPDGDALAYAWSFDDSSFSTNNQPWTFKQWSTTGDHVVRCVVSDMKGGVASANALVTLGAPTPYRISGQVLNANNDPIEGVLIDNGLTNSPYLSGYTDSDGNYVLIGATGDVMLYATKYGFTFTNLTWMNPLSVTSDVVRADFIAMPVATVSIAASTNSVPENSAAFQYFTLTRTGDTSNSLTVQLNLSGTASRFSDFVLSPPLNNGTNLIVIPPGSNNVTFTFQTINDSSIEGPETVSLTVLDDPAYILAPAAEATITILDDDAPTKPAVSVVAINSTIEENGLDPGVFRFSRTGSTQSDLTVFYSAGGTATPGTDYTALLGAVVIPAGSASATVQFLTIDDKNLEAAETVLVSVSANAAYTVSGSSAQITILDDDLLTVTISPTDSSASEPSTPGRCTVKRDGDLSGNLLVYYTVAGTATSGTDYVPLSGSLTIPAGAASADIVVTPLNDALLEGDESVIITLATNAAYNIGTPASATFFIRDDEKPYVTITATDPTASEPGDDTGAFTISRGSVVNGDLTVNLGISGSAIPGSDYLPLDNPVVIPNGASSITLDVIVFDDLHRETNEDVIVTLLTSTNYNLGSPSRARVQILDDDPDNVPAVGFSLSASSAEESKSPGVSVSLSVTSSLPISVDYRVIGGTASSDDYFLPPGTLTFEPGEWAKSIPLTIINDNLIEPNETIRLTLFNPVNATLDGIKVHTYTILDDDTASVSVAATVPTTSETGAPGNFRISRSGSTNAALLVNFQVTGTASAPSDYLPIGSSGTIPAGATFVDVPVVPVNDLNVEYDETVKVTLLAAPGAKIVSPNVATVTITDNDPDTLPVVTITSTNHPYGVEGGGNGEFVFARGGSTNGPLPIYFSISGTASNGVDYAALTNVITIPDGQPSVSLPVVPIDDNLVEGEETVVVSVTVRDTYRVGYPAAATVIVQDNDQRVRLDASDFIASEPGTDQGEFTFTRFGTTNTDLRVFYTISGTASNGTDYVFISNSFTIPAGRLSATLPIVPIDDLLVEGPETVTLTLLPNAAYSLDQPTNGTVTIMDDEPMVTLLATVAEIVEGSQPPAAFRLTRTGNPKYEFTAHLGVGGTATYGVDYPAFLTNVYFAYGVTAIDLLISPTNELVVESSETVTAALLPDPAYTILAPSNAVITILDAKTNPTPFVTITSPTASLVFLPGTNVNLILEATVSDDADTNGLTFTWSQISGPEALSFGSTNELNTTVTFTNVGVYVLRLTADDGQLQGFAELTAVVGPDEMLSTNLLHWALDDGAGTNVFDSSGAGRNGIVAGTPIWVTNGVLGGALSFAGTNSYARQTSGTNFLNGLKEFSLALWIKPTTTNPDQGIFSGDISGTNGTLGLYSQTYSAGGTATNFLEATLSTSKGQGRHISASTLSTQQWQHLALTWSNGLAPALYINGRLDQPLHYTVALSGFVTNCLDFLLGKGPAGSPGSWSGLMDEVRVFPRALSAGQVAAMSATNYGPVVNAGSNVVVQITTALVLAGLATDDGKPNPPGVLSNTWSLISGPAAVTITNVHSLTNTIAFSQTGEYVFRLVADDGQVKVFDDVTVTVTEPTRVDVLATDSEAAELGPDTGEFTFTRNGDTNFELSVFLALSGTASNGADFIGLTNVVTFPAGTDTVRFVVVPFLDHRIEGDETLIVTIVSNLAYTIGSGQATVTIHDSPYGVWSVQHFTLEELTLPNLSSEAADFDHDGLVNFAEYAANLDPKTPETNSPLAAAIELNPNDGRSHLTLTYHRRLPPTDAAYAVYVSNDLVTWNTGTNYVEEIQATDDGNSLTETVKARIKAPYPGATNTFATVRVWLLATGP
jgi:hypothetical protein